MDAKENLEVARGELIGTRVRITKAANKALEGLSGEVVDETRHFIIIETAKGRRKAQKRQCIFLFKLDGKTAEINGRDIEVQPEERIRIKVKYGKGKDRWK